MTEMRVAHTADLADDQVSALRVLLDDVFGTMSESSWEHALGGMHALVTEGAELVGHASLVQRRLVHQGRALRAGWVEAVAVRADRRGAGYGAAVMKEMERLIRAAYELGALGASPEARGFYAARGWTLWRGPSKALTPDGIKPTPSEDGAIYVLPVTAALDPDSDLICDWRDGTLW